MNKKTKFGIYTTSIAILMLAGSKILVGGRALNLTFYFIIGLYIGSMSTYLFFGSMDWY